MRSKNVTGQIQNNQLKGIPKVCKLVDNFGKQRSGAKTYHDEALKMMYQCV